jgi:hypothetical protein
VVNIRQKKKQRERYLCKIGGDVYKRTRSELAIIVGEDALLESMKEYREGKCHGPYSSAAELIRGALESDDDED